MQCVLCQCGKMNTGQVVSKEGQPWFCLRLEQANDRIMAGVLEDILIMLAKQNRCPSSIPYPTDEYSKDAYLSEDIHGKAMLNESEKRLTTDIMTHLKNTESDKD